MYSMHICLSEELQTLIFASNFLVNQEKKNNLEKINQSLQFLNFSWSTKSNFEAICHTKKLADIHKSFESVAKGKCNLFTASMSSSDYLELNCKKEIGGIFPAQKLVKDELNKNQARQIISQ